MSVTFAFSVVAISMELATVGAAWIAALAIVALVLTGWRQPARAQPRVRRGEPYGAIEVDHRPGERYRPAGPIRRVLALLAGVGITIVSGAIIAIVLAFAIAFTVIRLTGLLAS